MGDSQPLSMLARRKTHPVRGPRPCSWMSSSSDSSSNEHRDSIWSWTIRRPNQSRGPTLRLTTSTESSDSGIASSSSSPVHTSRIRVECVGKSCSRHARRRKPAGPRAPRNSSCFGMRPGLRINTSLPVIPQFQREAPPTTPVQSAEPMLPSPQIPPSAINPPTNFPLDWDAIFEILGCSEAAPPDGVGGYS